MTTFRVTLEVASPQRSEWEPVEVLVDTGSTFTTLPRDVLEKLHITPVRSIPAQLADGSTVESQIAHAFVRLEGSEAPDLVLFGEPGEVTALGAHTLEAHLLTVDPVNECLVPIQALRVRRTVV